MGLSWGAESWDPWARHLGQQPPADRLASRSFPGKSITHPPGVGITGSATWCNMCRMFIDMRANPF